MMKERFLDKRIDLFYVKRAQLSQDSVIQLVARKDYDNCDIEKFFYVWGFLNRCALGIVGLPLLSFLL